MLFLGIVSATTIITDTDIITSNWLNASSINISSIGYFANLISNNWVNATNINATSVYGSQLSGILGWGNLTGYNLNSAWTGLLGFGNLTAFNLNQAWTGLLGWGNLTGYNLGVSWLGSLGGGNITAGSISNSQLAAGIFSAITGLGLQSQNLNMGSNSIVNASWVNATNVNVTGWVNASNANIADVVIQQGSGTEVASYIIFTDGTNVYAKSGTTGAIEFQGTNASEIIQRVLDATGKNGGGKIFIKSGKYTLTNTLTLPLNASVELTGDGALDTLLDSNASVVIEQNSTGDQTLAKVYTIDGFDIRHSAGNVSTISGIRITHSQYFILRNLRVRTSFTGVSGPPNGSIGINVQSGWPNSTAFLQGMQGPTIESVQIDGYQQGILIGKDHLLLKNVVVIRSSIYAYNLNKTNILGVTCIRCDANAISGYMFRWASQSHAFNVIGSVNENANASSNILGSYIGIGKQEGAAASRVFIEVTKAGTTPAGTTTLNLIENSTFTLVTDIPEKLADSSIGTSAYFYTMPGGEMHIWSSRASPGIISTPFWSIGAGSIKVLTKNAQPGTSSASPSNATAYKVMIPVLVSSSEGTDVNITIRDASRNVILTNATGLTGFKLYYGFNITFTFATVPTVTVAELRSGV